MGKRGRKSRTVSRGALDLTIMIIFILCAFVLISCKNKEHRDAGIRIRVTEERTKDDTVIQIPAFVTENEEVRKNLRELEKETLALQKTVEKEEKKGTHMEMRSYLYEEAEDYPQVTVIWYLAEEDTLVYNLTTLAADNRTGEPVTCKEALEKTGMSGVDLSLQVGRLVQENEIRGELLSTEMQGFRLGEDGNVEEIYMKLILKTGTEEEESTEEHFFSYVPGTDTLVRLSEKGFDIP